MENNDLQKISEQYEDIKNQNVLILVKLDESMAMIANATREIK
jgi:hypothetical protein